MTREAIPSYLCLALLLGGCPKRQTGPNVVYVPPSPPPAGAASAPTQSGGTMVVQEPAPPEPEAKPAEVTRQEPVGTKPAARVRRRPAATEAPVDGETPTDNQDQPAAQVPALEPLESPQQQNELRNKAVEITQSVKARIARLEQAHGANLDHNTLDGARMFLAQSQRALDDGDLQRAYNLARKASLSVDGLEQKP